MTRYLIALILMLIIQPSFADLDYTTVNTPVELRAIWINADAIPKTEKGIRDLVRSYHKANLNVLLPEVVCRGYTVYPSKLLARDPRFKGTPDPLLVMISEAHKIGMEVHPWVWVFRAGYTKDRGGILTAHPDWIELSKYGEDLSANGGLWISPSIPAARNFLISLYSELVRNYDVDGIHLDYIRYEVQSPTPYGYCENSRKLFENQYGVDPISIDRLSYEQYSWNLFRERQINTFVQRASLELRAIRPNLIISAAVGSDINTARLNLMQNWANWVDNKWVDFLTPMTYTANDIAFLGLVNGQIKTLNSKVILAPGIGLHMQTKDPAQTVRQVGITRQQFAQGQALFASSYFGEPQIAALLKGPYAQPAFIPFRSPAVFALSLSRQAEALKSFWPPDLFAYYTRIASELSQYAAFKSAPSAYVTPTQPPLSIPENVVPLPTIDIHPAVSEIKIDGTLDDPGWANAAQVQLAYDNLGSPASVSTKALLAYDEKNLYIAFESSEPEMAKIKAVVVKRDGPTFYDDSVEAFVDPTNQRREYYHLSTNTLGTRFDQKVLTPAWNGEWSTASKLGSGRWTTEIAIPFSVLGAQTPEKGAKWAINLTRNRAIGEQIEYITWAVPYGGFHSPDRFGTIVFQ